MLGLALALVAFPGVFVSYDRAWLGVLFVPALLVALAALAARRGVPARDPGAWLTSASLRGARAGRAGMDERRLVRRLLLETALWIVGVTAWVVLHRSSGLLIFGTGLASVAFGVVQAFAARRRVLSEEHRRGERFVVAERPGLGTPKLGAHSVSVAP